MPYRTIVTGSRRWNDRTKIVNRLADLPPDTTVVHGGARGADSIAHQEAQKLGLLVEVHKADWERYGKPAGLIRNHKMAEMGADLCLAFLRDNSTGTLHMVEEARRRGIPVEVIE